MRASPSLSQLWQPHSRLCQLCRVCEQQRSCSPGFCRKELHATESAVEVRRARRRLREAATDERVGVFTPDKKRGTADGAGRAANLAARRGTVCGEVGRVLRFPQLTVHALSKYIHRKIPTHKPHTETPAAHTPHTVNFSVCALTLNSPRRANKQQPERPGCVWKAPIDLT